MNIVERCALGLGGRTARLARSAAAVGSALLLVGLAAGHHRVLLGALCASFLFFVGLAAGALALSAAIRLAEGLWGEKVHPLAQAAGAFLQPSILVLTLLLLSGRLWMPGLAEEPVGSWLGLVARDLLAGAALVVAARRYTLASRGGAGKEHAARTAGGVFLFVYVVALTTWAIDLVMGLSDSAPSSVVPPLYFMGALLAGTAFIALLGSLLGDAGPAADARHDLGKLVFGLAIFWAYLVWAAFLPTWYANVPDETAPLMLRWSGGWRTLALAVIAAIALVPFWLLLPEANKRRRATLALGAGSVLLGLLGERFLLVLPSVGPAGGAWPALLAAGAALSLGGAFVLAMGANLPSGTHAVAHRPAG